MTEARTLSVLLPFDTAVRVAREALTAQGFTVVATVDLHSALAAEIGADAADEIGDCRVLSVYHAPTVARVLRDGSSVAVAPTNVMLRRARTAIHTIVQTVAQSDGTVADPSTAEIDDRLGHALDTVADIANAFAPPSAGDPSRQR